MTDAELPQAKKGTGAAALKKQLFKSTHPPTSIMVNSAIESLKERGGSSLQAIKKFIAATYKIDAEKLSPFIKKYLKNAVVDGKLIQVKGTGATGSFKLAAAAKSVSAQKKAVASKTAKVATSEKKPAAKKAASPVKKTKSVTKSDEKKKTSAKVASSASAVKVPKEKLPKATSKKAVSPKPKKSSPAKKPAPKKAAAPKKK